MFLELVIAVVLGVLSGIFTGLFPGIHVNLISVLLLSLSPLLLSFTSATLLCVYIISLAITHSFLDSLPSIYLGAPDEAQALSVLPGHVLLHRGEGHNAILCTVIGSYGCLLLSLLVFPLFLFGMAIVYPIIDSLIGYILIVIMAIMILREKGKRLITLCCFLLAGALGVVVLSMKSLSQPLFPLLSGLFGFSIMLVSLMQKATVPAQDLSLPLQLPISSAARAVSAASLVGFVAAFLPGFGNSQAAIVANEIIRERRAETFLTLVGGINTANMLISIGTVYALSKARNGAIVAVRELVSVVDLQMMILFLGVALVVGSIASLLTVYLSKVFSRVMSRVNYVDVIFGIILLITCLTFIFDGLVGLVILLTATCVGLMASFFGVGKNHLMGSLIVPVILYFIL
ncbi:hypothetical protein CL619_03190 [archaeon]|nr:hypothetical protein [archaeon]|tara:strand:+ start:1920 stop:3125 length:1206 start_codon:yes stop_codon:yes gene_type:complete